MALSTYTELQAAVAGWINRTDLGSVIIDCISLAEERFNRRLRTRHQELTLADTAISNFQITQPTGFLAVKQLWRVEGTLKYPLEASTLEEVAPRQGYGDTARLYAIGASVLEFDGTGTVGGVLYRTIPPLASNSTNWLLTNHPSLYLYASVAEVAGYIRDTEALSIWEPRSEAKLNEVARAEARDAHSGPATVRVRAYTP